MALATALASGKPLKGKTRKENGIRASSGSQSQLRKATPKILSGAQ
jgi:hypothetical protein